MDVGAKMYTVKHPGVWIIAKSHNCHECLSLWHQTWGMSSWQVSHADLMLVCVGWRGGAFVAGEGKSSLPGAHGQPLRGDFKFTSLSPFSLLDPESEAAAVFWLLKLYELLLPSTSLDKLKAVYTQNSLAGVHKLSQIQSWRLDTK